MRKGALLLAVLLAACFTTTADAAKKKKRIAKPAPAATSSNQNAANFVGEGFRQIFVPIQSLGRPAAAPAKVAKRTKSARKKSSKKKMRA